MVFKQQLHFAGTHASDDANLIIGDVEEDDEILRFAIEFVFDAKLLATVASAAPEELQLSVLRWLPRYRVLPMLLLCSSLESKTLFDFFFAPLQNMVGLVLTYWW